MPDEQTPAPTEAQPELEGMSFEGLQSLSNPLLQVSRNGLNGPEPATATSVVRHG